MKYHWNTVKKPPFVGMSQIRFIGSELTVPSQPATRTPLPDIFGLMHESIKLRKNRNSALHFHYYSTTVYRMQVEDSGGIMQLPDFNAAGFTDFLLRAAG